MTWRVTEKKCYEVKQHRDQSHTRAKRETRNVDNIKWLESPYWDVAKKGGDDWCKFQRRDFQQSFSRFSGRVQVDYPDLWERLWQSKTLSTPFYCEMNRGRLKTPLGFCCWLLYSLSYQGRDKIQLVRETGIFLIKAAPTFWFWSRTAVNCPFCAPRVDAEAREKSSVHHWSGWKNFYLLSQSEIARYSHRSQGRMQM